MNESLATHSSMAEALDRLDSAVPYGSIAMGQPDEGEWFSLEAVCTPAELERLVQRTLDDSAAGTPRHVAGNYLFRYLLNRPLLAAGYLFAAEGCVPLLQGNVVFRDEEWLQHARLLSPTIVAGAPGEPGSLPRDASALFAEVERAFEPVLAAFEERRYVARANAWGSILDALIQGFLAAGKTVLGQDQAWRMWEDAVRDRPFPLRRRPRRFSCDVNGIHEERAIRAGCCLWYMVPASQQGQGYCGTCYLMSDEQRTELIAAHQQTPEE